MARKKRGRATTRTALPDEIPFQSMYKQEYCELLIDYGKEGRTIVEFLCDEKVKRCREAFDNWVEQFPEFAEAKRKFKAEAEAWWLNVGREHVLDRYYGKDEGGTKLNANIYKFIVAGRFGHTGTKNPRVRLDPNDLVKSMGELLNHVAGGKLSMSDLSILSKTLIDAANLHQHEKLVKEVEELKILAAQTQSQRIGYIEDTFEAEG